VRERGLPLDTRAGCIVISGADRIILSAAQGGQLTFRDGYWRCGDRRLGYYAVRKAFERGAIVPVITEAGREILAAPVVNHHNERAKQLYRAKKKQPDS
jgi:hypothetical protein